MKHSLYLILYIAAFVSALTACSESEDLATTPANGKVVKINVSPYPAFAEDTGTRSVGTFDAGKTAWEAGDKILLMVGYAISNDMNIQHITLTYDGTEWTADKPINWLTTYTMTRAVYAPDWTFDMENAWSFTLKENAENYGTSEFLGVEGDVTDDGVLSLDFSNATRNYSRLRIAGEASSTVNVAITNFSPFGTSDFKEYNYSLTTDEKGNAYLYGSWKENASLTIKGNFDVNGTDKEITLFSKSDLLSTSDITNKGYVADARLSYKNEGTGTEADPYKISLPEQLAALATEVNSGTLTGTEQHFALQEDLDLSDYPDWIPIGSTGHPFTGVFDGQGHTIRNLTIANSNPNNVKEWGLFGMVQGATIQFVKVNGNITLSNFGNEDDGGYDNKDGIGGIAGRCSGTVNFYGCHNNVSITGTGNLHYAAIGGIVGFQIDGHVTLIGCANTGRLQALGEGYASQIATAGFIGTVYTKSNTTTVTAEDGFTEVNGSDVTWQTAKDAMNACLSTNHPDFGYQYAENKGADATTIPLVLQATATSNNE